jgi:predicted nucleic-acid-binding protein
MDNADDLFKDYIGRNDAGLYHTVEESNAVLLELAEKYPEICSIEKIGKSFENRDIYCLKISDNVNETEKDEEQMLVVGAHHAREWISVEVPLEFARYLAENYSKDDKVKELVDNRRFFIIPVVNPDGLEYSQKNSKYWRKNRRKNSNGSYGVDLNRNYGYEWGNVGASSNPGSDTYHGTGPFSEPESSAIKALCEREKFSASISFHSYGKLVLHPFGYGYDIPNPKQKEFEHLSKGMAKLNGYRAQNSAELYPAMGDSDDWFFGEKKIYSFTFELGRTFIPSENEIESICKKNIKSMIWLAEEIEKVEVLSEENRFRRERKVYEAVNMLKAK